MFLATSSIFWWWTLRNLVISDHIILEKKASMIGIFVCSWCCFFPICKYLETFKRFVEERTLSLTCWWGYSLKFPHTTDTSLPDASLCMPFQTHYHILLFFLIVWQGKMPPPPHNLTPANHHVKHSFSFLFP